MAFPWVFASNWQAGSVSEWDSESDTDGILTVPHYTKLARFPWSSWAPYRGAYAMRIAPAGGTNDATLTEGDIDIADAATRYFRFYLNFSPTFTGTADDTFNLFELQQAGGTIEMSFGGRIVAATNVINLGVGDGTAPSDFDALPLARNQWHCIELAATVSTTGSGALTLYVDGRSAVALTSLTQAAAVGQGVLGLQNHLATTTGQMLFAEFVMDDAQVYPFAERFPLHRNVTMSQHVFCGPGTITSAALMSTGASDTLYLYDTDTADTNDAANRVVELNAAASSSAEGPFRFRKGCYASLSSSARGQVIVSDGCDGPAYYGSDAVLRGYGLRGRS
jgi:hypothetical protein